MDGEGGLERDRRRRRESAPARSSQPPDSILVARPPSVCARALMCGCVRALCTVHCACVRVYAVPRVHCASVCACLFTHVRICVYACVHCACVRVCVQGVFDPLLLLETGYSSQVYPGFDQRSNRLKIAPARARNRLL